MPFGFGFYFWDSTMLILIPALLFALYWQFKVKSTYRKYQVPNRRALTGAQAAEQLLRSAGINDVRIEGIAGEMTDHYDPKAKVIRLSQGVYGSTTISAVGIACHEAGHAVQHAGGYVPLKLRNTIIPVCNIGSALGVPLAFVGLIFDFSFLIYIGIGLYALIALFQLLTLPVEVNASRRALAVIEEHGLLSEEEYPGAKKVLTAAAMTYLAALISSLASLLRFALIFLGRRRND